MSESAAPQASEGEGLMTNLGQPWQHPVYNFPEPEPLDDPNSKPTFSGPNREIYNQHYMKLREFDSFPPIPDPSNYVSSEEYKTELLKWQKALTQFSQKLTLPITMGHYLPRPVRPEVISQADREDIVTMRKLKRQFNPETSPAAPGNAIALEEIIQNGTPFTYEDNLPYCGLNEKPVPIHAHLENSIPWTTSLIPVKPEPFLYEYFDDYEEALLRWANIVKETKLLPPSPSEIGKMTDLQSDNTQDLEPPPPPKDPVKPVKPLTVFESNSRTTKKALRKLFKSYTKWQNQAVELAPPLKDSKVPILKAKTYTPPHAGSITALQICKSYMDYGVPYTPLAQMKYSNTQLRRRELMTLDVGCMAVPDLNEPGPLSIKLDLSKLTSLLTTDVHKFLLADLSPRAYLTLLYEKTSDPNITVGQLLTQKLTVEELVKFSMMSTSIRFLARCSITAQYFLGLKATSVQVLELLLPHLERFVELLAFSSPCTFSVPELPDEELSAATEASPKQDQQIEQLANDFRQAQLLKCFQSIVFTSPDRFFPFFAVIRPLIHKCFCRLSDVVMSDVTFPLISEGFMSENLYVHMFYYRLLRTIVEAEYSRVIRVFAIHDLFKFFLKCVTSQNEIIRKDANSLWQLMMHSDSSLALRIQILSVKPSIMFKMLKESPPTMQQNLIGVFSLFRCNNAEFDYRPFPLKLYKSYIDYLCPKLDNPTYIRALELLLGMMMDYQSIYCQNRNDLKEYANQIMKTGALQMMNPDLVRCLKILYKNELLEPASANNHEIWKWIFETIVHNDTKIETILDLWEVFRNAVLHQLGFVSFILLSPDLTKLLEDAFSSLDEKVSLCMILILPALSRKRPFNVGEDHAKHNLEELFKKLSDKQTVRIAGRLLAAYQSENHNNLMARVHSALVEFLKNLINADPNSYLGEFKRSVDQTLEGVFRDVEKKMKN